MPMRRKAVPVASRSSSAPRPRASGWQNRWTGQARVAGADRKVPCFQLQHHAAGGQFVFPQAADQLFVSRHRYASGSAGWVRSVLKVVSALIDLVSRDGPTKRVSSPRALAASDGPSSPRWRRASLSVSAWRWPSRVMLCDASFRAWTAPIPGSRRAPARVPAGRPPPARRSRRSRVACPGLRRFGQQSVGCEADGDSDAHDLLHLPGEAGQHDCGRRVV